MKQRQGIARLLVFSAGDFSCNLYWQGITLFLVFHYTDVLGLSPAAAGAIYMVGALWDGIADLVAGWAAERVGARYRRFVLWGALPLGLAFVALFVRPALAPSSLIGALLAIHLVFRSLYAAVNIPYAAWSVRISGDSRDRALVAGARMMFGAGAATLVGIVLPRAASGGTVGVIAAAAALALLGTAVLMLAAWLSPEHLPQPTERERMRPANRLEALRGNRAFVTLVLASMAATVAGAILGQSALPYFAHVARAPGAGVEALAAFGVASLAAVPIWTVSATRFGTRAVWLAACGLGLAGLAGLGLFGAVSPRAAQAGLVVAFVGVTGTGFAFWALMPDSVDYGVARGGVRVEALAFGVAALLQKLALAAAAGIIGLTYEVTGYAAGATGGVRWLMIAGPAAGLALSAAAMLANPVRPIRREAA